MGLAIAKEKKLNYNPYLDKPAHDREIGFHLLLAGFFLLPKINPVLIYQFLAPLFLVINALFLFFLVYKLTKNYWIGLFSIFFFASIRSNLNLMGNWFFTPATFTLFLVFIYFYCFTKAIQSNKADKLLLTFAMIVFLVTIIIYPLAAVLMALISLIFSFTRLGFVKKNWKYILFFGLLGLIIVIVFVKLYFWTGTMGGTLQRFLEELVFKKGWTVLEHTYSLISLYGVVALLLAAIGAVYLFFKKKNLLFILWPAALLINMLFFILFSFSLFFPYQRNFFYLLISLAPLSAMGLYWLSELLFTCLRKYVFKKKACCLAVCALLVLLVLFITFKSYYKIEPQQFSLHKVITMPEYNALLWLKENYPPYKKVLAKPFLSTTVYPISMNRVVGLIPSSVEGGTYARIYDFFNSNCNMKQIIVDEEKVDFVISDEEISCSFLGKIYQNDRIMIYQVG
jgi:hypothetical protein